MLEIREDPLSSAVIGNASEPFRKICAAVAGEIHHGDPAKAYDLVSTLLSGKRMDATDQRCMIALKVALRALIGLRAAGLDTASLGKEFDFRHLIATQMPDADFHRIEGLAPTYRDAIQRAFDAGVDDETPCPNCSGSGPVVGWARPTSEDGVAHARIYMDLTALQTGALAKEGLSYGEAHVLGTVALAALGIRMPVRQCENCDLRYVARQHDPERLANAYSSSTGGGFELAGERVSGRAHSVGFTYAKAALPLHLRSVVGDLHGLSIYDFGCAEGVMAAVLADLGAEVSGGDLDAPKINYAHRALSLASLTRNPSEFWSMAPAIKDGIIAFHTLEHVLEPDRYLGRFRALLKPGGFLAVSVPRTSVAEDGEVREMGGAHLIGFDETILSRFLDRHGFRIVDLQVDDGALDPARQDPLLSTPQWAGRPGDVTIVARRRD